MGIKRQYVGKGLFMIGIECGFCGHEVDDSDIVCRSCRHPYAPFENKVAKYHRKANDIFIERCMLDLPNTEGLMNHFERLAEITTKLARMRDGFGGNLPEELIERAFLVLYDEYALPQKRLDQIDRRNKRRWWQFWKEK